MTLWQAAPSAAPTDAPTPPSAAVEVTIGVAIVIVGALAILILAYVVRRLTSPRATPYLIIVGALVSAGVAAGSAMFAGTADGPVALGLIAAVAAVLSATVLTQVNRIVEPLEERDRTLDHYASYFDALDRKVANVPSLRAWSVGAFNFADLHQPAAVVVDPDYIADRASAAPYAPRHPSGERIDAAEALDYPTRQHTLVLGDPGYGKSWLLRATAARHGAIARQALQIRRRRQRLAAVNAAALPVWVELPRLAQALTTSTNLDQALVAVLAGHLDADHQAWLTRRLTGPCLLLLDSLDEARAGDVARLRTTLRTFIETHPDSRVVLTSRPIGDARGLPHPATTQTLQLLPFDRDAVRAFVIARFDGHFDHAAAVLTQFRRPALAGLAQVPLLLTLLCYLAYPDYPKGAITQLPTRRTELYDRVLREFLATRDSDDDVLDHREQRAVLEHVALTMSTTTHGDWRIITHDELLTAIHAALPAHRPPDRAVVRQLTAYRRGILLVQGDALDPDDRQPATYQFLHRTFHEHLLASALPHCPDRRAALVAAHRWFDDEWRQVLLLLASQSAFANSFDPDTYLASLASLNTGDSDPFFHGLFLAAHAAAEHPDPNTSDTIAEIVDLVRVRTATPCRPFVLDATAALAPLCVADHASALANTTDLLGDHSEHVRVAAAEALQGTTDPTTLAGAGRPRGRR